MTATWRQRWLPPVTGALILDRIEDAFRRRRREGLRCDVVVVGRRERAQLQAVVDEVARRGETVAVPEENSLVVGMAVFDAPREEYLAVLAAPPPEGRDEGSDA